MNDRLLSICLFFEIAQDLAPMALVVVSISIRGGV